MLYSDYATTTLTDYNRNRKREGKGVTKKKVRKERAREKKFELLDIYANRDKENR